LSDGNWRLGAFFAAYFVVIGVFAPYFPLYLEYRGLSAAQIGVAMAMAQSLRVVGPTLWGYVADHTAHRLAILRWSAAAACLSFVPIGWVGGFLPILAVTFAFNAFITAQMPLAEAIVATSLRGDPLQATRYGRLRMHGSIGFVASVLVAGELFERVGIAALAPVAVTALAVAAIGALYVRDVDHGRAAAERVSVRSRLREPRVRWFFVASALMVCAHGAMYSYLSLYLQRHGYATNIIGALWVVGVLAEIAFFYWQGRVFARYGPFAVLSACFPLTALRFLLIAALPTVWPLLLIAQLLHAVSFAAHHSASILTIQHWFPGSAAARGQALYISIAYGIGGTAGSLIAAWLWSAVSPAAAFLSSSAAALLGWIAMLRARRLDETGTRRGAESMTGEL
jgi:PPP family 3-phenylpropionic acid transporter